MSGKGKRRSARLLKLEEQKNDDDDTATADAGPAAVCLLDPWQIIRNSISGATRGKRKRNDEIQRLQQGEASCSQAADATTRTDKHLANMGSTGQIIEYILDMLELRDTHELFAMPDDIQVGDYAERVNRPGDFATLRQKNTDGMYKTLEQFENDVYMVFQKAMSINSQDTVPYKEATSLLEQAKQMFLSLKSNQMYSETELLAWRQKHLDAAGPSKPAREQGGNNDDVHAVAAAATPAQQRPTVTPAKKKAVVAEKRPQAIIKAGNASADKSRAKPRAPREGKSTPGTAKRARKAPATAMATAEASGGARMVRKRLTYDEEADQGRGTITTTATPAKIRERHATLLYHPQVQGHTYQDSLRRFVRHAGLKARVAAEFRSLECETRARQHTPSSPASSSYWSGLSGGGAFSPGASAGGGGYRSYPGPSSSPATAATPSSAGGAPPPPECKLETDGLLRLVMLVGTPAFLERAKQAFGDLTRREESSSKGEEQQQQRAAAGADDEAKAMVAVTAGPAQRSTGGASDQGGVDFGPFAPPKLVPGRLGFGQFAGTSGRPFKLKPPPSKFPGRKKRE